MRTRVLFTTIAFALVLVSFKPFNFNTDNQVCIYGLVYKNASCGSKVASGWTTRMTDKENRAAEMEKMEKDLYKNNPNSSITTGSSSFDYGDEASNICILKIIDASTNCASSSYIVEFGTTQPEARAKAEKTAEGLGFKGSISGRDKTYEIAVQKYW